MTWQLVQSRWRSWLSPRLPEIGLLASFVIFFFLPIPRVAWLLLVSWLCLGVAAVLMWLRIEMAVALLPLAFPYYLQLLPLTSRDFPAFGIGELSLLICLEVALLRSVILRADREATIQWARHLWRQTCPFLLPTLLLLIGASLGLLVSPNRHASLRAYREEIVEPIAYCLLMLRYLRTRSDVARTIGALVASALILACAGILQGLFGGGNIFYVNASTFRVSGPTGSSNNLAFALERVLPILLALSFIKMFRRPVAPDPSQHPAWRDPLRWMCVLVMIPIWWALYWTDSRGAEVAMVVFLLFLLLFEVRHWLVALGIAVGGMVGGGLFWSHSGHFLNEVGHGAVSERFFLWKSALLIIRDHFFLGTGLDSFNTDYSPSSPNSYAFKALNGQPFPVGYNPTLSHPHNMILDVWISTGLAGLAGMFWLLGAFAAMVPRVYHHCAQLRHASLLQRLLLGIAGSMAVGVIHGMVDNFYFLPDLAMLFWFFVGVLLIVRSIAQRETMLLGKWPFETSLAMGTTSRDTGQRLAPPDEGQDASHERPRL